MTEQELNAEFEAAYLTALGNICYTRNPTEQEDEIARNEANEHIAALIQHERQTETRQDPA